MLLSAISSLYDESLKRYTASDIFLGEDCSGTLPRQSVKSHWRGENRFHTALEDAAEVTGDSESGRGRIVFRGHSEAAVPGNSDDGLRNRAEDS